MSGFCGVGLQGFVKPQTTEAHGSPLLGGSWVLISRAYGAPLKALIRDL